ncbi:MAG: ADP-glyceromanno-heptose 6-epimerase, partial [Campylobacterales bacterium]|nr:ADP-glyceromanno-heptose 6-epimerase [Campylobacterales bacterium]
FDAFVLGHFKNLQGFKGEVIAGDITDPVAMQRLKGHKFDYIFHQAAISDTTVMDQKKMVEANTNAFGDILDMAVEMGADVVYASSAGTYGNSAAPNSIGSGEEPENVYGFSKLMMDNLAARYIRYHPNLKIVGLRYFNVYGPREFFKGTTASMILQLGLKLLRGDAPKLFKWGEQKRDFVYIEDVVQANIKALEAKKSGVYNVGGGVARQYNELFGALTSSIGVEKQIEYIDNPYKFFQNHTEADISLTREYLGYEPRFTLEDGIKAYADEIKAIAKREYGV